MKYIKIELVLLPILYKTIKKKKILLAQNLIIYIL